QRSDVGKPKAFMCDIGVVRFVALIPKGWNFFGWTFSVVDSRMGQGTETMKALNRTGFAGDRLV
ncbi:MAG: hypothetical protein RID59_08155, partial [Hoeflea sp.]